MPLHARAAGHSVGGIRRPAAAEFGGTPTANSTARQKARMRTGRERFPTAAGNRPRRDCRPAGFSAIIGGCDDASAVVAPCGPISRSLPGASRRQPFSRSDPSRRSCIWSPKDTGFLPSSWSRPLATISVPAPPTPSAGAFGTGCARSTRHTEARAANLIARYGAPALLLSWVPLIGDAIVAAAGLAGTPLGWFSLWTILGKLARYIAVAYGARLLAIE